MKKLGIVAALALVTTVGGVYAAWTYAGGENASAAIATKGITITQGTESGASGMLSVTTPTTMKIDDVGSANPDDEIANYTPGWSSDTAGDFVFTFIPNTGAGVVTLQYTITINNNTYLDDGTTSVSIFDIVDADPQTEGVQVIGTFTYNPDVAGSDVYTIPLDTWKAETLKLNQAYTIDTYAEYEEYEKIVNALSIHVQLEDITK